MEYKYIGCFLDYDALHAAIAQLPGTRLSRIIEHPHVTFAYRPDTVDTALFGEAVTLCVTGYGNDEKNEGLRVSIQTENEQLRAMAEAIAVPHITLSVSETGEPVDTAKLTFSPVEPFCLTATFGGYRQDAAVDINSKQW